MEGSDSEDDYNKTFIEDTSILDKYQAASEVTDKALKFVTEQLTDGADIATLCEAGDNFIEEELKKIYCGKKTKKLERGIAFPTCICVNNVAINYSPLKDESTQLKNGDIVKVDLGAHIDGYFGHAGTTVIVGNDGKGDGEIADLIVGCHDALQGAIRTTLVGRTNVEVTEMIAKVASQYGFEPLEGSYSHKHRKHNIDEMDVILNKMMPESKTTYTFQKGDVFGLDIYLALGDGKARVTEDRCTVFKRRLENNYMLKSQQARNFFNEVNEKFPSLPFSIRACSNTTEAKIGVKSCLEHELLEAHEVHAARQGDIIVSFKATVAICPSGTSILCGNSHFDASKYKTTKKIEDQELSELLALSMDLKDQKKRNKAAKKEETKE